MIVMEEAVSSLLFAVSFKTKQSNNTITVVKLIFMLKLEWKFMFSALDILNDMMLQSYCKYL